MRRLALLLIALALPGVAIAQSDDAGIDVIDVSGPLDESALEFMADSIQRASENGQELVLLQINSKAVLDGPGFEKQWDDEFRNFKAVVK